MKKILNYKQTDSTGVLDIAGFIGPGDMFQEDGILAKDIANELDAIKNSDISSLTVNIDSLGGDLRTGLDIYNLFSAFEKPKKCFIKGWTASAATIIAQAFDKVSMVSNALWLIHRAQTIAVGNAFNFRQALEEIETIDNIILDIYNKKCKTKRNIKALIDENMGNGKWLNAKDTLNYGFVDEIVEPAFINYKNNIESIEKYKLTAVSDYQMSEIKRELKRIYNESKITIK